MPPEQTIIITHPNGNIAGFSLQSLNFRDAFEDQTSKLTMKVSKRHTILEDSRVTYLVDGSLKLIGQVDDIDSEEDGYDTITITSCENLFNFRATQPYTYTDGTTINAMLSDLPPTTGGRVGFIYYMNSGLDPDWTLYSGYIYKLTGGGTARLGAACLLYENDRQLTRKTSIGAMTAGTFYQDATDLYVWTLSSVDPQYRLMTVPNWKDTKVRLGYIENGTTSWTVPFKIAADTGMSTIIGILWAKFQEAKWVPNVDGYVYLTSRVTIGRGSEAEPIAVFKHGSKKVQKIKTAIASGQTRLNSVVAIGAGSGTSQLMRAATDLPTTVIGQVWRTDVYDAPACYGTMLSNIAAKLLSDRRDNKVRTVRATADWDLTSGDFIRIVEKDAMPIVKRIMAANFSWPENTMELEAGKRQVTFSDGFKKQLDMLRSLTSMAQSVATEWSESFKGNVDDAHPLTTTFNLPSGKIDTAFPYSFKIRFTVDPYETDTDDVETAAHNNGGATGSHSGYGGKSTDGKGGDPHSVPLNTATSTPSAGTFASSFSHSHSWGGANYYGSGYGSAGGDCYVSSSTHYGSFYGSVTVSTSTYVGGTTAGDTNGLTLPTMAHIHNVPAISTLYAILHAHITPTETAKTRTIPTEPKTPAEVSNYIKYLDTGNSLHYIDVTVKLNGTQIPGSPFLDLYIGDSINDVDAGSLVIVGENSIEVSIVEHSNPLEPVRCAINGSVAAEYFISNY